MTDNPRLASALIAVAVGGAVGAVARWACGEMVGEPDGFPATTFAINVLGSLLLAMLPLFFEPTQYRYLFFGPGVFGGFTTLSTEALHLRNLTDDGHLLTAACYLAATFVVAVGAVHLARLALGWRGSEPPR